MIKRRTYFLLVWLSALIVLVVIASVLPLLNYSLLNPSLWVSTNQFIMTIVLLIIVLSLFLGILGILGDWSKLGDELGAHAVVGSLRSEMSI